MSAEDLTRAVLTQDGRVLIEQPDGSYRPSESRTDWNRIRAMTDDDVARLAQLFREHEQAVTAGDVERHYELDQAFHSELRRATGNNRLIESLDRLQGQIRIGMFATHRSLGGMSQALDEHRAILEAVTARDPEAAERAARAHVSRLLEELRQAK
jgi:DNA-binding GntR family transcriptional regulator